MNNFQTWTLALGLKFMVGHINREGLVNKVGDEIDKLADDKLGIQSERLQMDIVMSVLLPLCTRLMKENPIALQAILQREVQSIGSRGQQQDDGKRVSGKGSVPQPGNRRA